ncbi:Ig-like domain-containing protein [Eubacterium ventriosum]|uniref:Ig-like domain-containing protein n=1 Tax=Eubacterium ventriosum TaxID=39496 RepID=UPI002E777569|nr:Ig-like domain-containing protein [Eubacterium ventriosum]MEE0853850.1 Ig-like domain-containing protein [Eubacterium ventriosum]
MKKFTANLVLVLLSILIGFSVHSSVYAADDAKVEIWSYSLNERIEHRSIEVGKSNPNFGIMFAPSDIVANKVKWSIDDTSIATVTGNNDTATVNAVKEGMTTLRLNVSTESNGKLSHSSVISVYTAIDNVYGKVNGKACTFYRGATKKSWIRSEKVKQGQELTIIGSCGSFYYIELPDNYTFDDGRGTRKAYVEKSKVYVPVTDVKTWRKSNDVKVGETTTVTSVVYPQIATVNKATYTTDNSSISTCDGNGNVQGKGEGYTRISATAENKKAICGLSVYSQCSDASGSLKEEADFLIGADSGENIRKAKVPKNQKVTVIGSCGNYFRIKMPTDFNFNDGDNSRIAYVLKSKVYVPVTEIKINKSELNLGEKDVDQLKAEVIPAQATNKTIVWSVAKKGVVEVDQNGKIKVVGTGNTTVIAKSPEGPSAACKIAVFKGLDTAKMGDFTLRLVRTTAGYNVLEYSRCKGATMCEVYSGVKRPDGTFKWTFLEGEYGQLCDGSRFNDEVDIGSTRYYKVVAKKKYVRDAFDFVVLDEKTSNIVKVTNGTLTLSGKQKNKKSNTLSWNKLKREDTKKQGYVIYRKINNDKKYKKLKEVTKKSYTDKSIKKKKKYSYKVRMFYVNEDGKREYSPYSNEITIKVK